MGNLIFDNNLYTKCYNRSWELLQVMENIDATEIYEILSRNIQGKEEVVMAIKDALKQHELMKKEPEKVKTKVKDRDRGFDR